MLLNIFGMLESLLFKGAGAGAGAGLKKPEPVKNGPAPQHYTGLERGTELQNPHQGPT